MLAARNLLSIIALAVLLASGEAHAQDDAQVCFDTADKAAQGGRLDDAEKQKGHDACQRALAETSSIVDKYHLQEADFDIIGRPPKPAN